MSCDVAGFRDRILFPWDWGTAAAAAPIDGIEELKDPRMSFTSLGPFISRRSDGSGAALEGCGGGGGGGGGGLLWYRDGMASFMKFPNEGLAWLMELMAACPN